MLGKPSRTQSPGGQGLCCSMPSTQRPSLRVAEPLWPRRGAVRGQEDSLWCQRPESQLSSWPAVGLQAGYFTFLSHQKTGLTQLPGLSEPLNKSSHSEHSKTVSLVREQDTNLASLKEKSSGESVLRSRKPPHLGQVMGPGRYRATGGIPSPKKGCRRRAQVLPPRRYKTVRVSMGEDI